MNLGFVFFFILIMGSQNSYSQDSFETILLKKNNERKTDLKEERKKKTEIKLAKNEATQNEAKAIEEESEETKPKKFKKNILADTTSAPDASGNEAISEHILKTNNGCYVVQFENRSGELISCTELLPLQYTKRDCSSGNILERGEVGTVVSCDDKRKFGMKFRNGSNEVVHFILRVTRAPEGKAGVIAKYRVESTSVDSSKLADMLPKPELKSVEDSTPPEEAPLKFKFSGFLTIEQEHSKKFGYDIGNATTGQAAQQNYNKAVSQPKQNVTNLLSNLNFELSKDRSALNAILEIGEVYFGNTATGGGQGLRANNTFELRNLYLSHGINDALKGSQV